MHAGGCLLAIVGSLIIAFLWAYPQAILATELGLMIDSNGGGFIWVHRAWGPFIGWLNGWNGMASSFINLGMSVYFSLFIYIFLSERPFDYVVSNVFSNQYDFLAELWSWMRFRRGYDSNQYCRISLGVANFRIVHGDFVQVKKETKQTKRKPIYLFSFLFFCSPFVALFIWELVTGRIHTMNWAAIAEIPTWSYMGKENRISLYLGTVVWAFGGFDSLGSIAGEIRGGKVRRFRFYVEFLWGRFVKLFRCLFVSFALRKSDKSYLKMFICTRTSLDKRVYLALALFKWFS